MSPENATAPEVTSFRGGATNNDQLTGRINTDSTPSDDVYDGLTAYGVPIVCAPRIEGDGEFRRPNGWQNFTHQGNDVRLAGRQPDDAVFAVTGRVAVIDFDPRNFVPQYDPEVIPRFRALLAELGVQVFYEQTTPRGGLHLLVDGHPDLPTTHDPIGWPGIDIQSHGANVYLTGTFRAKHGGKGYEVVYQNLEALVDGGDPDGAEALVGWLAEHRVSRVDPFEPSPPWTGTPPDARQLRYLAAALDTQCKELASTKEGGRNVKLNLAAVKLGNYIAGAGLDEPVVIAKLVVAATACGLVDDDGMDSVAATIRSGLRFGKTRPRAVPDPPAVPVAPVAPVSVEPGEPIDGADLLDDVEAFLSRFIVYPNEHSRIAHALWIAHAHLMDCWESTPPHRVPVARAGIR